MTRRIGLVAGDELHRELLQPVLQPARVFSTGVEEAQDELDLVVVAGELTARIVAPLERLRIPYGFLSVGAPQAEWLDVFRKARFVTVRDHLAFERVQGIDAWWLPDPAFLLALSAVPRTTGHKPAVVLVPQAMPEEQLQLEGFRGMRREFRKRARFEALVLDERDRHLSPSGQRPRVVGARDAARRIASADAVITSRLQAAVIAACVGTPFAIVEHDETMRGFAGLAGLTKYSSRPPRKAHFRRWLEETLAEPKPSLDPAVARAYGGLVQRVCTFLREGP